MKGYGQFCPVAKASEILCARWTPLIVRELAAGSRHFNELRRGVPLMSPSLLSRRLKELTQAGVVHQIRDEGGQPGYELTRAGEELRPLVEQIGVWGHRWVEDQFEAHDLDIGLLMWDIRRGVDPAAFPSQRVVLQVICADAPEDLRYWWLVSGDGEVDLCHEDPGFEVDLVMHADLRALTEVWMRRRSFADAKGAGLITVVGDPRLKKRVADWLRGSPIARKGEESLAQAPT